MKHTWGDVLSAVAFFVYVAGIPVSFGVSLKVTDAPAPLLIAPFWPVVGLGYIGYRLAP
jgi:hypothetical protein